MTPEEREQHLKDAYTWQPPNQDITTRLAIGAAWTETEEYKVNPLQYTGEAYAIREEWNRVVGHGG